MLSNSLQVMFSVINWTRVDAALTGALVELQVPVTDRWTCEPPVSTTFPPSRNGTPERRLLPGLPKQTSCFLFLGQYLVGLCKELKVSHSHFWPTVLLYEMSWI